jgi:integrase
MDALSSHFKAQDQLSTPVACTIKKVKEQFANKRATKLTAAEVNEWITERRENGDKKATINRATQLLKQAYKFKKLPMPGPEAIIRFDELDNARQGFFTDPEIRRVMARLPEYLADFALFGWGTGMRRGEIAGLKWTYVQDGTIRIPAEITKTKKAHSIPLVGELAEVIQRRRAARSVERDGTVVLADLIFHRDGEPVRNFRRCWQRACVAEGLGKWVCPACRGDKGTAQEGEAIFEVDAKGVCPKCLKKWKRDDLKYSGKLFHDLRRSAVRDMINAGVPQADAMKISGHRTTSMFQRYNIRDDSDARRALELVQAHRKAVKDNMVAMTATAR